MIFLMYGTRFFRLTMHIFQRIQRVIFESTLKSLPWWGKTTNSCLTLKILMNEEEWFPNSTASKYRESIMLHSRTLTQFLVSLKERHSYEYTKTWCWKSLHTIYIVILFLQWTLPWAIYFEIWNYSFHNHFVCLVFGSLVFRTEPFAWKKTRMTP